MELREIEKVLWYKAGYNDQDKGTKTTLVDDKDLVTAYNKGAEDYNMETVILEAMSDDEILLRLNI